MSGADARVVVHDSKRLDFGAVEELRSRLSDLPGATVVTPPRMSDDGDTALITVQYDIPITDFHGTEGIDALRAAAQPLVSDRIQVEFGGQVAETTTSVVRTGAVTIAVLILVLAFGSVVAAVTLVPALRGLLGHRLLPRSAGRDLASRVGHIARWAALVGRPVIAALVSLAVLAGLAAPGLAMWTWSQDTSGQPTSDITGQAYDLVATEFGPGANGPLAIVVDLTKGVDPDELVVRLRGEPGLAKVPVAYIDGVTAVITAEPTTGPQDERTTELLRHLRASVLPDGVLVTGPVAASADGSDRLASRLWIVVAFVVALSLPLLTVLVRPAMRSPSSGRFRGR